MNDILYVWRYLVWTAQLWPIYDGNWSSSAAWQMWLVVMYNCQWSNKSCGPKLLRLKSEICSWKNKPTCLYFVIRCECIVKENKYNKHLLFMKEHWNYSQAYLILTFTSKLTVRLTTKLYDKGDLFQFYHCDLSIYM
jgi:hypothetical protein